MLLQRHRHRLQPLRMVGSELALQEARHLVLAPLGVQARLCTCPLPHRASGSDRKTREMSTTICEAMIDFPAAAAAGCRGTGRLCWTLSSWCCFSTAPPSPPGLPRATRTCLSTPPSRTPPPPAALLVAEAVCMCARVSMQTAPVLLPPVRLCARCQAAALRSVQAACCTWGCRELRGAAPRGSSGHVTPGAVIPASGVLFAPQGPRLGSVSSRGNLWKQKFVQVQERTMAAKQPQIGKRWRVPGCAGSCCRRRRSTRRGGRTGGCRHRRSCAPSRAAARCLSQRPAVSASSLLGRGSSLRHWPHAL